MNLREQKAWVTEEHRHKHASWNQSITSGKRNLKKRRAYRNPYMTATEGKEMTYLRCSQGEAYLALASRCLTMRRKQPCVAEDADEPSSDLPWVDSAFWLILPQQRGRVLLWTGLRFQCPWSPKYRNKTHKVSRPLNKNWYLLFRTNSISNSFWKTIKWKIGWALSSYWLSHTRLLWLQYAYNFRFCLGG